jgi:hypothetical protein
MYIAKLVCCVPGPVKSIDGPAISPDNNDLHLAVLKQQEYFFFLRGATRVLSYKLSKTNSACNKDSKADT